MGEEKMFVVCNIPKLVEKFLDDIRSQCVDGMSKENREGYDFAVESALTALKEVIYAAEVDGGILVHSDQKDKYELEEFDLHDLIKFFGYRVIVVN